VPGIRQPLSWQTSVIRTEKIGLYQLHDRAQYRGVITAEAAAGIETSHKKPAMMAHFGSNFMGIE
jgi:hypothetical protein